MITLKGMLYANISNILEANLLTLNYQFTIEIDTFHQIQSRPTLNLNVWRQALILTFFRRTLYTCYPKWITARFTLNGQRTVLNVVKGPAQGFNDLICIPLPEKNIQSTRKKMSTQIPKLFQTEKCLEFFTKVRKKPLQSPVLILI